MNEVGDRREAARRWDAAENQPISGRERALVARAYALFDCFYDQLERGTRADAQGAHAAGAKAGRAEPNRADGQHAGKLRGQHDRRPDRQPAGGGDAAGAGGDGAERRGDGRRGELCALPRGMAGQVSDADGGRHRDGHGGGAGISGTKTWRTARAWSTCWRGIPEDFYPDPMYEDIQDGRGCFKATHTSVAWVEEHYPQAKGYVTGDRIREERTRTTAQTPEGDDAGDAAGILVQEIRRGRRRKRASTWRRSRGGRCCSARRRATARRATYPEGLYAHGEYPFVLYKYRDAWRKAVRHGADLTTTTTRRRQSTDTPNTSTTTRGNRAYSGTSSEGGAA